MKRILLVAVALLAIAGTASFAGVLYQLPWAGAAAMTPTGANSDGSVVVYSDDGSVKLWSRATNTSAIIGATTSYTPTGVVKQGSTVVVAGNSGGVAQRWDGTSAGVGTWSALPTLGGTAWAASGNAIASNGTTVWIGGLTNTTTKGIAVYDSASNATAAVALPSSPHAYVGNATINAIASNGHIAGTGNVVAHPPLTGTKTGQNAAATLYGETGNTLSELWSTIEPNERPTTRPNCISSDGKYAGGVLNGTYSVPVVWDLTSPQSDTNKAVFVPLPVYPGNLFLQNTGEIQCFSQDGTMAFGYSRSIGNEGGVTNSTRYGLVYDVAAGTSQDLTDYIKTTLGVDMAAAGWTNIISVIGVAADGSVIGSGKIGASSLTRGFVVVVPEPGSILALLTGCVGLVALRRRR